MLVNERYQFVRVTCHVRTMLHPQRAIDYREDLQVRRRGDRELPGLSRRDGLWSKGFGRKDGTVGESMLL